MSGQIELDELEAAYRRLLRLAGRVLDDAYEFASEAVQLVAHDGRAAAAEAAVIGMISALERDRVILQAGFFLLIFGHIDNCVTELARRRQSREDKRAGVRNLPFERRLDFALPGGEHQLARREIGAWSNLRNEVAHGEPVGLPDFNIPAILDRAKHLERLLRGE